MRDWPGLIRRAIRKSPAAVARRAWAELAAETERLGAPRRARGLREERLLAELDATDLDSLWRRLRGRPHPCWSRPVREELYERLCPGDRARIHEQAERALAHRLDLLGSGPLDLGVEIDWLKDHRSGRRWELGYCRSISYGERKGGSDVKMAWDLSRMNHLVPVGQAYLLEGGARYALETRRQIEGWIAGNPHACSVNWACTMDVALRAITWTWLFHVYAEAPEWKDVDFRFGLLRSLFLHGDFVSRNLEKSDVNGNHYAADAAGLVALGAFFGEGAAPREWERQGWEILLDELPLQVFDDGVDHEASIPYHRLVIELFLLPLLYRRAQGSPVPAAYEDRVRRMMRFVAVYARGPRVPLFGDADNGRVLPFGGQAINDHRYLPAIGALLFEGDRTLRGARGDLAEVVWWMGPDWAERLVAQGPPPTVRSAAFPQGGFYVLSNPSDHVVVDCGSVGLRGRGGHGHNDCLSLDVELEGTHLVSDSGCYVYTSSWEWRNHFRATDAHNTPRIDGQEINRLDPAAIWNLSDDAQPEVRLEVLGDELDLLVCTHTGYMRLPEPVRPVRTILLDHRLHRLVVRDTLEGSGDHEVSVPWHLAPGIAVSSPGPGAAWLDGPRRFQLVWDPAWAGLVEDAWHAPSYGVKVPVQRLRFIRRCRPGDTLTVVIAAGAGSPADLLDWARRVLHDEPGS
jgi:hypothetical protein